MPQSSILSPNIPIINLDAGTEDTDAPTRPRLVRTTSSLTQSLYDIEPVKNTVLKSHGRPPWYDEDGKQLSDAFVIGIAGGSASGKTHVARQILKSLGSIPSVVILSQDSFYKEHTKEELELAFSSEYDFDHPDAIDMPMFAACLSALKKGRQTNIPVYSFQEHQRLPDKKYLYGASVIITEGILALHDPKLRALYDLKIFVKCDSDLMLARRIARDVKDRGRSVEGVLSQYLRFVKPSYDDFVLPTSRYADIIVPGLENTVAIDLITTHVRRQLDGRSRAFRENIARMVPFGRPSTPPGDSIAALKLHVLEQTPQLQGIYTILRDQTTSKADFIFFADRLSTLLMERAMVFLPFCPKTVETPVGATAVGKSLDTTNICGVTILRSGGPLEQGLRRVISDIRIGSLLVQTDLNTGEPLLLHVMLPECIRQRDRAKDAYVFVLDAQIGTAATAFMAIRVLLDHGVQESRIIFVAFLVALAGGLSALRRAFPDVHIITGAVDGVLAERRLRLKRKTEAKSRSPSLSPAIEKGLDVLEKGMESLSVDGNEDEDVGEGEGRKIWVIEPGLGQIGDRYYL